jgi:hypothetical protein
VIYEWSFLRCWPGFDHYGWDQAWGPVLLNGRRVVKKVFNPTVWLTVFVILGALGSLSSMFDSEAAAEDTWGAGNVLEHDAAYELALNFAFLAFPIMALFTLIFIPGRQVRARILTAITIGFLILPISFVSVFLSNNAELVSLMFWIPFTIILATLLFISGLSNWNADSRSNVPSSE